MKYAQELFNDLLVDLAGEAIKRVYIRTKGAIALIAVRKKSTVSTPEAFAVAMSKYLRSHAGTTLLQAVGLLAAKSTLSAQEVDLYALQTKFEQDVIELLDPLHMIPGDAAELIASTWESICAEVELCVAELKTQGLVHPRDLLAASHLTQARTKPPEGNILAPFVREYIEAASTPERSRAVEAASNQIRSATAAAYKYLRLPHVRQDHHIEQDDLYVHRDLVGWAEAEHDETLTTQSWIMSGLPRIVVTGNPGAGKSTFVRNLLYRMAQSSTPEDAEIVPFLLNLRETTPNPKNFCAMLAQRFNDHDQLAITREAIEDILSLGRGLVVFDGLDEIVDLTHRRTIVRAIEAFARRFPLSLLIVTSREVGYNEAPLDPNVFPVVGLKDFSPDQVREYVERWFALNVDGDDDGELTPIGFLRDSEHIAELRANPLMLSLICSIYRYEGYIPENRPEVYEECAELLFDRWDRARRIPRAIAVDRNARYLVQELAYFFFKSQSAQGGVGERQLQQLIVQFMLANRVADAEDARAQAAGFLEFCAGRAWLLTKTGTGGKNSRQFNFTHRTFMEYFAARYIARNATSPQSLATSIRPFIAGGASEVVPQIAVQWYDEKEQSGGDRALRVLLFGSETLTVHTDLYMLPFALRLMQFFTLTPPTAREVLALAIGEMADYRLHRVDELARLLAYIGRDSVKSLQSLLRSGETEARVRFARTIVEFVPALLQQLAAKEQRSLWAKVYKDSFGLLYEHDLCWSSEHSISACSEWMLAGQFDAEQFVQKFGPEAALVIANRFGVIHGPALRASVQWLEGDLSSEQAALNIADAILMKPNRLRVPDVYTAAGFLADMEDTAKAFLRSGRKHGTVGQRICVPLLVCALAAVESGRLPGSGIQAVLGKMYGSDMCMLAGQVRTAQSNKLRSAARIQLLDRLAGNVPQELLPYIDSWAQRRRRFTSTA